MILKNEKLAFKVLLLISVTFFGCSTDGENNSGGTPTEQVIPQGTTNTIVRLLVDGDEIPVFLSIPEGCDSQSLPAVVVMHGSDGMWTNRDPSTETMSGQFTQWQNILAENCIVGAFVDSYTGRGVLTRMGRWRELPDNFRISAQFKRPKDANATLAFLQNLTYEDGTPVVIGNDIGLLGFSDGASAVAATLFDIDKTPDGFEWTQSQDGKVYTASDGVLSPQPIPEVGFSGGVFYYGGSVGYNYWGRHPCNASDLEGNVFFPYAPMLYQIPSDDVLTENTLCLFDVLEAKGAPVSLEYYEGITHGFDFDGLPESEAARKRTLDWFNEIWSKN